MSSHVVECPRCKGTGSDWPGMICGTCSGKGTVDFEVCPYCKHPKRSHNLREHIGIYECDEESASGSFMCGCDGAKTLKSTCNVCGKDQGNSYCLNRHLGESPTCKAGFVAQFYEH